jgi:hypothetical protein
MRLICDGSGKLDGETKEQGTEDRNMKAPSS